MKKRVLLVNPWIEDFSAFDQWIKPIPLLKIARWLKEYGYEVYFVDCLDRSIWGGKAKKFNSGKFRSEEIKKPEVLSFIPRKYKRFGGSPDECRKIFEKMPAPDFIFSGIPITYWYIGLCRITSILREIFPSAKIVLGGNYVTLLPQHARQKCHVDFIIRSWNYPDLENKLKKLLGEDFNGDLFHTIPDLSFYPEENKTSAILTTQGCPFKCTYCAVPILYKGITRRKIYNVVDEILYLQKQGIEDVAFFDDALLVNEKHYFKNILKKILKFDLSIRFHLPNAIHARYVDKELAQMMFDANFKTIRLGLESASPAFQAQTGNKVEINHFIKAVENLFNGGFSGEDVGAYVMFGAPGTNNEEVKNTIEFVHSLGVKVFLVTYSPVPGTPDFFNYAKTFPEVLNEPLLHNKVVVMYLRSGYDVLKKFTDSLNKTIPIS